MVTLCLIVRGLFAIWFCCWCFGWFDLRCLLLVVWVGSLVSVGCCVLVGFGLSSCFDGLWVWVWICCAWLVGVYFGIGCW